MANKTTSLDKHLQYKMFLLNKEEIEFLKEIATFTIQNVPIK